MFLPKTICKNCKKLVTINILQVSTDGIVAQCSQCGEQVETSKAVEQEVYRFLNLCTFGGKHRNEITGKN